MLELAIRTERPESPEAVQPIVAEAAAEGRRLEVLGGGTKRGIGAAVGADLVLQLDRLDRVVDYAPEELVLTAQAGVRLADLERLVAAQGQMLAFEPPRLADVLGVDGQPTLGGVLAANLSGPRRIRAGAARDHFLGFSGVSGRGEAFKAGGKVVKNVTGYDLCKLMAGSWGTLTVLTEATIKVLPAPRTETTLLLFGLEDARAAEAMAQALNSPAEVSAAAHLPAFAAAAPSLQAEMSMTALRLEGFEASVAARRDALAGLLRDFGQSQALDREHSRALWADVREVRAFHVDPRPLWRVSLPPTSGWKLVQAAPGDALYDWAGGLVWLLPHDGTDAREVRAAARALGGHAMLYRGGSEAFGPIAGPLAALSRRVKAAFDPQGVLNPGRMALEA